MGATRSTRSTRGVVLAVGNTSDVLQWTPSTVVKLLRPGIPAEWAHREADIASRVHAAGLPVPATDGTVEIDGRTGIVFERIHGESMWDRMKASPRELPDLVTSLVDLQTALHLADPIAELPPLVPRVRQKIREAVQVSEDDQQQAVRLLDGLPDQGAICHGDMHPANILMSPRGLIVVDWFDAAIGHPIADRARSALLMRPSASTRASAAFLGGATRAFLTRLHGTYLATLRERGLLEGPLFADWEAVLAVARLSEPVPAGDLQRVWAAWRARSVSAPDVDDPAYQPAH